MVKGWRSVVLAILRRALWLYAAGALAWAALIQPQTAALNRVNILRSYERELELFENGGRSSLSDEDLDGGLMYYRRLETILPDNALVQAGKGFCYYYQGDRRRAWEAYHKAEALEPNLAPLFWDMGMMSVEEGRDDEARDYLERFLTLVPAFERAYGRMGLYYQKQDQPLGLLLVGHLYDRDRLDQEQAFAVLVEICRRQGQEPTARMYYREGMRRFPESSLLPMVWAGEKAVTGRLHVHSELLTLRYLLNAAMSLPATAGAS